MQPEKLTADSCFIHEWDPYKGCGAIFNELLLHPFEQFHGIMQS